MAKVFAVTSAAATVRLSKAARGECVFTVTNIASRPVRGRALPVALDAVAQRWLSIAGATEREFAAGETTQVAVVIAPAGGAEGRYGFRLDMEAVGEDDGRSAGPAAYLTIEAGTVPPPPPPRFPWWWLVAVLLVLAVGLGLWLGLRGHGAHPEPEPASASVPPEPPAAAPAPEAGKPVGALPERPAAAAVAVERPASAAVAARRPAAPAAAAPASRESAAAVRPAEPAAIAEQWLTALRERDLSRLDQLSELPFLCDGELVHATADLGERYRRLANGEFAGIAAKRVVAKRVADVRHDGKALPAAAAELRLTDDDQVVAVLAAAGGKELHLLLYLRGGGRLAGFTR